MWVFLFVLGIVVFIAVNAGGSKKPAPGTGARGTSTPGLEHALEKALDQGDVAVAVDLYTSAAFSDRDALSAHVLFRLGEACRAARRYDDALELFDLAEKRADLNLDDSQDYEKHMVTEEHRALVLLESHKYALVEGLANRIVHSTHRRDDPYRMMFRYLLARACEGRGLFAEAEAEFQRVYAEQAGYRDVGERLAALRSRAAKARPPVSAPSPARVDGRAEKKRPPAPAPAPRVAAPAPPPMPMPMPVPGPVLLGPGARIEKYVVEREIGSGGFGKVYRVQHESLGSVHALKVLAPELVVIDELRQRFLSEGRIQARLRHPGIVPVTDTVAAPGVAGLVMDFIDGETLDAYVARLPGPPGAALVRRVFLQVLEAVGFAHRHGVVHRDLKPANILVEWDGDRPHARVLDFGIAKVLADGPKAVTRTGMRMGTVHYMSPEQVRGAKDVTARSDIFSLGATLYEFATRAPAFDGDSDFDIQTRIVNGQFPPLEVVHPGVEPRIAAAAARALAPSPAERFESCEEFASALAG